jgi:hexokinase
MAINMEWGNFDANKRCLSMSLFDVAVDEASPNKGYQLLEKQMSGFYLSKVAWQIYLHLAEHSVIPALTNKTGRISAADGTTKEFAGGELSSIIGDYTAELTEVKREMERWFGCFRTTVAQRRLVKELSMRVALRSARYAAAMVSAIVVKLDKQQKCTVAVDGSLFHLTPKYKHYLNNALDELFSAAKHDAGADGTAHNIKVVGTLDGSGVGAALIAALA